MRSFLVARQEGSYTARSTWVPWDHWRTEEAHRHPTRIGERLPECAVGSGPAGAQFVHRRALAAVGLDGGMEHRAVRFGERELVLHAEVGRATHDARRELGQREERMVELADTP